MRLLFSHQWAISVDIIYTSLLIILAMWYIQVLWCCSVLYLIYMTNYIYSLYMSSVQLYYLQEWHPEVFRRKRDFLSTPSFIDFCPSVFILTFSNVEPWCKIGRELNDLQKHLGLLFLPFQQTSTLVLHHRGDRS